MTVGTALLSHLPTSPPIPPKLGASGQKAKEGLCCG